MTEQEQDFSFKDLFVPLTNRKAIVIISLVGFLVYFNSLFNGFVWDDTFQIINNYAVINAQYAYYFNHTVGPFYKPFMFLTYILLRQIVGVNPFFYHFLQITIHIANTILIFLFFKLISKKSMLPFFLSLLFLIHPINVETVNYIADLQDVLFLFFGLSALVVVSRSSLGISKHIITVILLIFSLLSKETGILFVIIYPIYFFTFKKAERLRSSISASIAVLTYLLARYFWVGLPNFHNYESFPQNVIYTAPFSVRLLTMPKIIYTYLEHLVLPTNLYIQYWIVSSVTFYDVILPFTIDAICFGIAIGFAIYIFRRNKDLAKIYIFFFFWFCIGLGIHLQIVPLDKTVSDRWFYFPFVGFLGMLMSIVLFLKETKQKIKIPLINKPIFTIIIAIVYLSFTITTILHNTDWYDYKNLLNIEIRGQEDSFEIQYSLGYALMLDHDYKEAIFHFQKALIILPNNKTTLENMCMSYLQNDNFEQTKKCENKAIELDNNTSKNYSALILVNLLQNNPKQAKQISQYALQRWQSEEEIWRLFGLSEYLLHDNKMAEAAFEKSYALYPNSITLYYLNQIKENQPIEIREL